MAELSKKAKAVIRARKWALAHPERVKAAMAKSKAKHRERIKARARAFSLLKNYGITPEDKQRMYEAQNGLCAICRQPIELTKSCTDHNHVTAAVRELLCLNCNSGLGHFKERPERLLAAIAYLAKHTLPIAA